MKHTAKHILLFLLLLTLAAKASAQTEQQGPARTPEQEAAKQTEMLQRMVNLTDEQAEQIMEINLKYAIERRQNNSRADAVDRMRRKNADYKRVLTAEQYELLMQRQAERRKSSSTGIHINLHFSTSTTLPADSARPVRSDF